MDKKDIIAKRVAQEFSDGQFINLGIGIPTLAAKYVPNETKVILHAENGAIDIGALNPGEEADPDLVNGGGEYASINPGGAIADSVMSFCIIRGGHLDATVLGAMEVDQCGNLANWSVPGKMIAGMGGAMDLAIGAKRVIVAMEHTNRDGSARILKQCTLPLTAQRVVDLIVTNLCVFGVTKHGLVLHELAPGVSMETVEKNTEAEFIVSPQVKEMQI